MRRYQLALLAGVGLGATSIGLLERFRQSRACRCLSIDETVPATPGALFERLRDVEAEPRLIPGVEAVTVLARVGDPLLRVVSAAGEIVAEHRRAPVGGGQTLRTPEHAAMLERAVLEAFTTGHACRRKANVPPGRQALAELARLRGLDAGSAPVISLERYAQLAKAANR